MSRQRWDERNHSSDDDELGLWLGCALSAVLVLTLVAVVVIAHWWR
jgi:hypothetical protein